MSEVLDAADKIEVRMARSLEKAARQLQDSVSINELALWVAAGNARQASAQLPAGRIEAAYVPAGAIARDAVERGGKLGAAAVNRAIRSSR